MKDLIMTTRQQSKRPKQDLGPLKAMLVVGSMAATLGGTRLLAMQAASSPIVDTSAPVAVVVPSNQTQTQVKQTYPMPPTWNGSGQATTVQLQPIPQAVTPNIQVRVVAQSRSSR